jgi:hypothetical protein
MYAMKGLLSGPFAVWIRLFSELSVRLSQACLGKISFFIVLKEVRKVKILTSSGRRDFPDPGQRIVAD